ncbi:DNA-binding transcriptional activator of the SARP family [Streptomyces sp. 3213]|uniref:BTAD domain-containing putative transcriptional regulator n=1 Tax=Streptomyces sp. 3213.3 TaxID=1855348 RepID=UPI000894C5D0|nr:BTAD domain-containing putative transcriptional regulator [Streptomyces sp. 3213.3]SED85876.1 DNA-binding transcriptional activator of the SARP family [Streptomyces sp. 3213] [Streptomyces sp. 3213.3]
MRCELRFGLLGTTVLYGRDGDLVRPIGSTKVRVLLAALLLEPGRVVSVDALKDALWGGSPPASAHASLHNHVTRLRRLLDDPERLRAIPPGYQLRVDDGELDVHVFESYVTAARAAHADRDWPRTVRACTAALALWRGTPLSGLPAELGGYAFAQRLTEARLLALEWRYDAELALGGPRLGALVPELAALVADHPLREGYHRQLMLALHRTGRQPEALAVHRDLRNRLIEELGIEPGAGVREAHVEVLRGVVEVREGDPGPVEAGGGVGARESGNVPDASGRVGASGGSGGSGATDGSGGSGATGATDGPGGAGASGAADGSGASGAADGSDGSDRSDRSDGSGILDRPPSLPRPAQLPPPPAHFTGRADTLDALRDTLARRPSAEPGSHPLVVISGMAGVGKSALALHTAHALREHFPDGQLYVNLHGATPGMAPLTAGQALHALLRDLGAEPRHIPEHPDAAAALLRSLLAPTRTLMLLDDAGNAAQVRPLLPGGTGCAVLVTSRSPLTALDGARRFPLAPLSGEDSAALLRAVSGRDGLDAAHPLVELTGRLPLALRVVAARLAARKALTPAVLAGQLAATESRLPHLEYDDLSVRRSLAVAHDALAASDRETDRDAALTLHHIGALDLPAYGAPLLARLTTTAQRRAEAALDRLVDVALLEETAYGRYTPHDLVRDFARELAAAGPHGDSAGAGSSGGVVGVGSRGDAATVGPRRDSTGVGSPGGDTEAGPPTDTAAIGSSGVGAGAGLGGGGPVVERAGGVAGVGPCGDVRAAGPGADGAAAELRGDFARAGSRGDVAGLGPCGDSAGAGSSGVGVGAGSGGDSAVVEQAGGVAGVGPYGDVRAAGPGADGAAAEPHGDDATADGSRADVTADGSRGGVAAAGPGSDTVGAGRPGDLVDVALAWYAAVAERTLIAIVEPGLDQDDRRRPTAAQLPGHAVEVAAVAPFRDSQEAFAWGDLELENVVALVNRYGDSADRRRTAQVSTLVRLFFPYVLRGGRVAEMEVLGRVGLGAARRLGDDAAEAYALGDLAGLHFLTGRQSEALGLNDQALAIWWRLDATSWIRRCLNNRGLLLEGLGRHAESGVALRQSLAYSRQLDDPYGEAVTYSHLGNLYEHTDPRAAIEQHRRSLAIGVGIGAVIVQHSAHCNIGYAHLALGEPAAALPHFEESLRILGDLGDWHGESQTRLGLVRALRLLGRTEAAGGECAELLSRADTRADRYMGGLARHQLGLLLREQGRVEEAYEEWRTALAALDGTDEKAVVQELGELLSQGDAR